MGCHGLASVWWNQGLRGLKANGCSTAAVMLDTNGYEYLEFGLWHPKVRTKNPGRGQCQEIPPACYLWCWGLFHCWFGCRPELLTFCFKCVWRCHAKRFWFLNQNCLRPTYRTDQDWSAMPIRATCQVPSCMIHLWESRQKGHWFGSRDSPYTACIGLSWFVNVCQFVFGRCCIFVPNDSPHFICLFVLLTISPTCLSISLSALLPVPLWNCSSNYTVLICFQGTRVLFA